MGSTEKRLEAAHPLLSICDDFLIFFTGPTDAHWESHVMATIKFKRIIS